MTDRNSNIEILRIISILLIIAYHATRMQSIQQKGSVFASVIGILFGSWGILGVDVFVIICAWFSVEKNLNTKKLFSIVFQTFIYLLISAIISFIYDIVNTQNIIESIKDIILHVNQSIWEPLWSKHYWFVTAYLFLMIVSPYINKIIHSLSKENYKKLIVILSFIPFFSQFNVYTNTVSDIACFAYIYFVTGYLKIYGDSIIDKLRAKKWFVIISLIIIASNLILLIPGLFDPIFTLLSNTTAATVRHSVIMFFDALALFILVIKYKPKNNPNINMLSSFVFGVYLFHSMNIIGFDGDILDLLMKELSRIGWLNSNIWFPFEYILLVLFVFISGVLFDAIRKNIIQKPIEKRIYNKFELKFEKINSYFNMC